MDEITLARCRANDPEAVMVVLGWLRNQTWETVIYVYPHAIHIRGDMSGEGKSLGEALVNAVFDRALTA